MDHRLHSLVTLAVCGALVMAGCGAPSAPGHPTSPPPTPAGPAPTRAAATVLPSPSAATAPDPEPSPTAGATARGATPTATREAGTLPALALAAEVPWQPAYTGDPLRLTLRLSSPRANDALLAQYLAAEGGQPTPAPGFAVPAVPADWAQGVTLTLYRLEAGGERKAVLEGTAWVPHLRQRETGLPPVGKIVWSDEWLVPAEAAQLEEGEYIVAASWSGEGVDSSLLGPDGAVKAEEVRFAVSDPANGVEKSVQAGRLAYCAYAKGDYAEARAHGQEALDLGIDDGSPERFDMYFLVAAASFALEDYPGAIAAYERVTQLAPPGSDLALLAQQWIDIIEEIQSALAGDDKSGS